MKTLHLNLKRQWFDMIKSGEKKEEYRDFKGYYYSRLIDRKNIKLFKKAQLAFSIEMGKFKGNPDLFWIQTNKNFQNCYKWFDTVTFSNGYAKDRPQFEIELKGISIKEGRPEWGAEKGEKYFVLELGEVKSFCECGSQKRTDSMYCDPCNRHHSI